MKPVIGILPLWDDDKDSLWMLPGYMNGIRQAGALPLMLPLTEDRNEINQLVNICDGFLFTGGHDVSPELYHETPLANLISACRQRDVMEFKLLHIALAADKPILGICRGIQLINAALGGSLFQDLPLQRPSSVDHHQTPPYNIPVHDVNIKKNTPLHDLLQRDILAVNSYHHQAIKILAHDLDVMAFSTDGVIEAVYMPSHKFVWAVQWHPEFSYLNDACSRAIFSKFTEACRL